MLPYRPTKQRIVVSCIVEHREHVLLLRGSQVRDEASSRHAAYFNLPRFTVPFGAEPDVVMQTALAEYFDQPLRDIQLLNVLNHLTDMGYTHEVEILYRANAAERTEKPGRYFFAAREEVSKYMIRREYERVLQWFLQGSAGA